MRKTTRFNIVINRWQADKLLAEVAKTNQNPSIEIKAVVAKKGLSASASFEVQGDEHRVNAFTLWARNLGHAY